MIASPSPTGSQVSTTISSRPWESISRSAEKRPAATAVRSPEELRSTVWAGVNESCCGEKRIAPIRPGRLAELASALLSTTGVRGE